MKTLVRVKWESETQPMDGDVAYEEGTFILLHFGLDYKLIETENGTVPVNFTVAVCQECKTGEVICFLPGQLRIIGKTMEEKK